MGFFFFVLKFKNITMRQKKLVSLGLLGLEQHTVYIAAQFCFKVDFRLVLVVAVLFFDFLFVCGAFDFRWLVSFYAF